MSAKDGRLCRFTFATIIQEPDYTLAGEAAGLLLTSSVITQDLRMSTSSHPWHPSVPPPTHTPRHTHTPTPYLLPIRLHNKTISRPSAAAAAAIEEVLALFVGSAVCNERAAASSNRLINH